jgi:hypothetical protein
LKLISTQFANAFDDLDTGRERAETVSIGNVQLRTAAERACEFVKRRLEISFAKKDARQL